MAPKKFCNTPSTFAFSFDIDGVLEQSGNPLPGAAQALQILDQNRIPFILLTNSGGKKEHIRVEGLSAKFEVPLSCENLIQSHTPFKNFVAELQDKCILVLGGVGNKCREVAEYYGYRNVITAADIIAACPSYWPFNEVNPGYYREASRPLPSEINPNNLSCCLKVDAIFVFSSPRDWGLEAQIITDLLLSHQGYLGTISHKNGNTAFPNNGYQQDGQPPLYFSNPDLVWSTAHHQPRFGQGAFREALDGVWRAQTKQPEVLKHVLGKPSVLTYEYAELMLTRHRDKLFSDYHPGEVEALKTVYMIGDNCESDIRGANEFKSPSGVEWRSLLVESGVYIKGTVPAYKPTATVPCVLQAVKLALRMEGWEGDF